MCEYPQFQMAISVVGCVLLFKGTHISKTRVPSIASAISHLSEIVGSPLLYHKSTP